MLMPIMRHYMRITYFFLCKKIFIKDINFNIVKSAQAVLNNKIYSEIN